MSTLQTGFSRIMEKFVSAVVISFPALFVLQNELYLSLISVFLFIIFLLKIEKIEPSREEKLLIYSSFLVFLSGISIVVSNSLLAETGSELAGYFEFLMLAPFYYLFKNYLKNHFLVYLGVMIGLLVFVGDYIAQSSYKFTDLSLIQSLVNIEQSKWALFSLLSIALLIYVSSVQFYKLMTFSTSLYRISVVGLFWLGITSIYIAYSLYIQQSINISAFPFFLALILASAFKSKEQLSEDGVRREKKLSVTVIAYNEADRLGDCLESVSGWADEIIVFDNGSTDGTIELAKKYTDKVFVTDWPGFGKQKQRALDEAQYEWVLSIDADERVTPALQVEIDRVLSSDNKEIAYRIPWAVTIYNKRLDFGRSGRAPLRLFKKQGAKFSEASVHEKVLLPAGKVGLLQERLLHYTHRNLNHAVRKFNDYAWLWGTERFEKGKRVTFAAPIFHGLWTFFVIYFLRLGMLDGFRGLVMAVHLSLYTFNKYTVLWTLEKQSKSA